MRGNLFAVAVDLVVLTVRHGALAVLLRRRDRPPFAGALALPGGFLRPDEDLRDAAARELAGSTGLVGHPVEQLAGYAAPGRDPRGRVLTVGHLALVPELPDPDPGTALHWHPVDGLGPLAFDHTAILAAGVERVRASIEHTTAAAAMCPPEFTVTRLRQVYEAVWATALDPRNFQRKVSSTPGFLLPTGALVGTGRGRPAQLFRRGDATALHPPMLRGSHL